MKALLKALDDPTRREILEILRQGELTAGDIAQHFNISKPSISYHLDLLKRADVVESTKRGQFVYYCINTSVLDELVSWIYKLKDKPNS